MIYFRWLHGLQSARPIKKVFLQWPNEYEPRDLEHSPELPWPLLDNRYEFEEGALFYGYAYHSRRLACIIPTIPGNGSDMVVVLDLETGQKSVWANVVEGGNL